MPHPDLLTSCLKLGPPAKDQSGTDCSFTAPHSSAARCSRRRNRRRPDGTGALGLQTEASKLRALGAGPFLYFMWVGREINEPRIAWPAQQALAPADDCSVDTAAMPGLLNSPTRTHTEERRCPSITFCLWLKSQTRSPLLSDFVLFCFVSFYRLLLLNYEKKSIYILSDLTSFRIQKQN